MTAGTPDRLRTGRQAAVRPQQPDPTRVYLGWQFARLQPAPGPPPRRPDPEAPEVLDAGWLSAQRRIQRQLARMPAAGAGAALTAAAAAAALWGAGLVSSGLAGLVMVISLAAAAACLRAVWRGRRQLAVLIEAERERIESAAAAQRCRQVARQREHAASYRDWAQRSASFGRQPQFFAVSVPVTIDRIDVAGGTLAGWAALLTMLAAPRLGCGGEVTVVDLTEGAVAADLLALAARSGLQPLVWVLPGDLPRLDLGAGLGAAALADVLALAVAAGDDAGRGDAAADCALLERVLELLGPDPQIRQVNAALRVLAQIGDPRSDLESGALTNAQLEQVSTLFGRSVTERVVLERAWAIESRLRGLSRLGTEPARLPPSPLRVAALDRRSGAVANKIAGTYLAVALTHMLRQAPAGDPWAHTVCLLGADKLRGDVLDRLTDACETSGTGLVLAYRSVPAAVRERLGRGNAAAAFMRLGNAEEARAASELIGTEHRFMISQLTDTAGTAVTGTWGDAYTSTVGTADSVSDSFGVSRTWGRSRGRGRSRHGSFAPFGDFTGSASRDASFSHGYSGSLSLTEGISSGTSWGLSTSLAVGENLSLARSLQRSREFLVEAHELQQLPPSAAIVSYPSPAGRSVALADANPAIIMLPTATLLSLDEARGLAPPAGHRTPSPGGGPGPRPPSSGPVRRSRPPDPGQPAERLGWRRQ